jgi:hypothetical protein
MNEHGAAQVRGDGNGIRTSEGTRAELRGGRRVEGDDVAFRVGGVECGAQSRDRRHAVVARRIEAVDRRDDARGAGPRGEERLRGVEYLRGRHAHAVGLQSTHGAQRLFDEGQLHDDLVGDLRKLLPVSVRVRRIDGVNRSEDGPMHEAAQFGEVRAHLGVRIVGEQTGRRDHSVEHAMRGTPRDVVGAGGGQIDLHAPER